MINELNEVDQRTAVRTNPADIRLIRDPSVAVMMTAVSRGKVGIIELIKNPPDEVCMRDAVNNPTSLRYVKDWTYERASHAVTITRGVAYRISQHLR